MAAIARLTQTITIVDKSNKVVGTGKQLKDVFYEAKNAYLERKAEIKAERKKKEDRELEKAIHTMSIADEEERGPRAQRHSSRRRRNSDEHSRYSHAESNAESRYSHSPRPRDGSSTPISPRSSSGQVNSRSNPTSPVDDMQPRQLIRRSRTDIELASRPKLPRSHSTPDVDLDLAYGEFHDGDLATLSRRAPQSVPEEVQQKELGTLVRKCQGLLDEANCAQHSVRKMVAHLQQNPDAMAAVALTLAEISDVASKMAPGALAMFKTSAPAVMALLASPQFLIAVGVGIGVTVVMFGGYKIVKKIKAHRKEAAEAQDGMAYGADHGGMDEALDVHELDRIENWRRGIADAQDDDSRTVISSYSAATSVEGEIITPFAAQSMGHLPLKRSKDKKAKKEKEKKEKERKEKEKKDKKKAKKSMAKTKDADTNVDANDDNEDEEDASGERNSSAGGESLKRSNTSERDRQLIKVKKPSPLRRMFVSGNSVKSS